MLEVCELAVLATSWLAVRREGRVQPVRVQRRLVLRPPTPPPAVAFGTVRHLHRERVATVLRDLRVKTTDLAAAWRHEVHRLRHPWDIPFRSFPSRKPVIIMMHKCCVLLGNQSTVGNNGCVLLVK